jgi:hypothetical protein
MNERWFINKFLEIAASKYCESFFIDDFVLPWIDEHDYNGPQKYICDVVEIDGAGRLHLWLFKSVRSPELLAGDMIGRLFACTQVMRMTGREALRARIEKAARRRRYDTQGERFRRILGKPGFQFDSWNLVACGGNGSELAGTSHNVMWQLYAPLTHLVEHVRDVNTWHFYQTGTGFDLRSIWDFAVAGKVSLPDKLAIYDGRSHLAPKPDDDFDISSKHDLHLKRKKGFHAQGHDAYFNDRSQILAR